MIVPNKLSWQLLRSVLSIYFSLTILITLFQMGVEYAHTRNMVQDELRGAERTFYPALATALWELNQQQVEALMSGITDLPLISAVYIIDPSGRVAMDGVRDGGGGTAIKHAFDVSYDFSGQTIPLARVEFVASGTLVLERLWVGFQMIVISAVIKSLLLTALFVWAFRRRLGRPLRSLTESVAMINLDSLAQSRIDMKLTAENELSLLQRAFNTMLSTLDRERRAHVDALTQANHRLEGEVQSRTKELMEANQRLEQLARTDALTGAANRRDFMERLGTEILRSQRSGAPLTVLAIDLDHFKQVNDRWGHAAGDDALVNFVRTADSQLRGTDVLARLGGEEFVILLPETSVPEAAEVAARILTSVRSQVIVTAEGEFGYTVSIGVAGLMHDRDDGDALLSRADLSMYRAKQLGRNRVEMD